MTIVQSGNPISLGDGGTNPTNDELLNTTFTSASLGTSSAYHRTVEYEPELNALFYSRGKVVGATPYGFRLGSSNGALQDTNPPAFSSSSSGYGSGIDHRWDDNIPNSYASSLTSTEQSIGWDLGVANSATVGSGLTSYADDNSNSRTITDLIWMDNTYTNTSDPNYSAGTNGDILFMALDGTGIPNTNDTFYSIIVNGVTLLRSDAQAATGNSNTVWIWRLTSSNLTTLGTTGSKTLVIKSSSGTAVNDGISEEFGGSAPDSLSEYYRGGSLVTSSASTNIPTSGAISFSNFYGTTDVPDVDNVKVITPGYTFGSTSGPRGTQFEHFHHGYNNVVYRALAGSIQTGAISPSQNGSVDSTGSFGTTANGLIGTGTFYYLCHYMSHSGFNSNTTANQRLALGVIAGTDSNAGFSTLSIQKSGSGTTFTFGRTNATYTYRGSGIREWVWSSASTGGNMHSGSGSSFNLSSNLFHVSGSGNGTSTTTTSITLT